MAATETLLEVTEWPDGTKNHTYLLCNGRLVAYRSSVTGEILVLKKPSQQWSKKGRKFKKVVDKELERAYTV